MKLLEVIRLDEMPIEAFNTIGDFGRNSSYRKEPDRRLVTNPRTVERVKTMWANTQFDFRMWFVNNAEANRFNQEGTLTIPWMQQNMPKTWAEMQQQGGIGPDAINMIFASNKGINWRPMTGWMMAHRMAHSVLAPLNQAGAGNRPIEYIVREFLQNAQSILGAYSIDMPASRSDQSGMMDRNPKRPELRYLMMAMGSMKSARTQNIDSGYEFIYECFAQYLLQGAVKFNPLPDKLIVGYSYGRPQYRRVYGEVDLQQANEYADYIAQELDQEFDRALNGVIGKIVMM
jgi:hypothetical protein